MSTNGESVDPYQVFEPEYWGESSKPQTSRVHWTLTRNVRQAERETAPLVAKIVNGEIVGSKVSEGVVFNPSDEDLSRTSVHNFVGSILLGDMETLHDKELPLEDSNLDHFELSARQLLQRSVEDRGFFKIYNPGRATVTDGEQTYTRKSTILRIVANRKRQPFVVEMAITRVIDDPESRFKRGKTLFYPGFTWTPVTVGDTYTRYTDGEFVSSKRLRSLELVASGAPAVAQEPGMVHGILNSIFPSKAS